LLPFTAVSTGTESIYEYGMADVFYLVIFMAVGCFMASRVCLLLSRGELNVKGVRYSRRETPAQYWVILFMAVLGAGFALAMAAIGIAAIINGR
jgi:hypothetical protein